MYATLETLRMFGACTAGYTRVCRAVGGIKYGAQTPIPLWIGAATGYGLSDVEWILDRGFVVNDDEYKALLEKVRPTLAMHVQWTARWNWCEFYHQNWTGMSETTRRSMEENPDTSLMLRVKTVMDNACNFTHLSEEDRQAIITFVKPVAFTTSRFSHFRKVRDAVLAYAGYGEPLAVLKELVTASQDRYVSEEMTRPWIDVLFDRYVGWAESFEKRFLTRPETPYEDDDDDYDEETMEDPDEEEYPRPTPKKKKGLAIASKAPAVPKKPKIERPCAFDLLPEKDKLRHVTKHWQDYYQFREFEASGLGEYDDSDPSAINAFLAHFDQKNFFSTMKLAGEREFNGTMLPNDTNATNPVDVLVRRNEDGTMARAVFVTDDPMIARQVARMVRASKLNVSQGIFSVGEEDEDGDVKDVPTAQDLARDEEDEDEQAAAAEAEAMPTPDQYDAREAVVTLRLSDVNRTDTEIFRVTQQVEVLSST